MITRTTATRTARLAAPAAAVIAALSLTACGAMAERATEAGMERLVESQTGADVDLDVGDGGFSIETDDGSFSVDADGNFVIEAGDGTFTGSADEDGFVVEGEDGVVMEAEFDADGSGQTIWESEDGSFVSDTTGELPADWPADVPAPTDLRILSSISMPGADGQVVSISAQTDAAAADYLAAYSAALTAAGFEAEGSYTDGEWSLVSFRSGERVVTLNVGTIGGVTEVGITATV